MVRRRNLILATVALTLALSACSSNSEHSSTVTIVGAPTASPNASHATVNKPGNVPVEIGKAHAIAFPGTNKTAVTVTLRSVKSGIQCTQQFAPSATLGQHIAVDMELTTAKDYESLTGGQPLRLFGNDFSAVVADGQPLVPLILDGGCVDNEFPLDVPAGATSSGVLILDAPVDTEALAWNPSTFEFKFDAPWEWPLSYNFLLRMF
jgi:hypothetical protein